jgi:hypothetical protein
MVPQQRARRGLARKAVMQQSQAQLLQLPQERVRQRLSLHPRAKMQQQQQQQK